MNCKEAANLFENSTKIEVTQIERCGVGIANYVFIVTAVAEKFILRCSREEDAYKDTIYWLNRLSACEIPIPVVLSQGKYRNYFYLILSYIRGDDIGNVYSLLNDNEKRQIAREVAAIQRRVSKLDIVTDYGGMESFHACGRCREIFDTECRKYTRHSFPIVV